MTITDQQVAVLRAQLSPGTADRAGLMDSLSEADRTGYQALVSAAFFESVDRRFSRRSGPSDVVEFVASVRSRTEELAQQVDPAAGERLIRYTLGDNVPVNDLDPTSSFRLQILLLAALVGDENLDEAGLDAFLIKVRGIADDWSK